MENFVYVVVASTDCMDDVVGVYSNYQDAETAKSRIRREIEKAQGKYIEVCSMAYELDRMDTDILYKIQKSV